MRRFERIVFFFLLASIPIQLGKHFWPFFAFVQGIRLDYLSPTLYISDILFLALLLLSFYRLKKKLLSIIRSPLFIAIFIVFTLGGFFAASTYELGFSILKFLELFYISFYIAHEFGKKDRSLFIFIFVLGGLTETVIAFLEFVYQQSIGGFFYYLGERTFTASTPGIAVFPYNDTLILRPYATFPHPNVLAFYLLFSFVFLLFSINSTNGFYIKIFKSLGLFVLGAGIFITFSRVVVILLVCILVFWLLTSFKLRLKERRIVAVIITISFISFLFFFSQRYLSTIITDLILRISLIKIASEIFVRYPLFGVGLNNFYYFEAIYQKNFSPILLQPVHSIYFLWLTQTGLSGFIVALLFFNKVKKSMMDRLTNQVFDINFYKGVFLLLISVFVIGMFDHYIITLQQAELLFALLLGLSFSIVYG